MSLSATTDVSSGPRSRSAARASGTTKADTGGRSTSSAPSPSVSGASLTPSVSPSAFSSFSSPGDAPLHHSLDGGSERQPGTVLYSDQFLTVYHDRVRIHNFYFPVFVGRDIEFGPGLTVATDRDLGLGWKDYKAWGMGWSDVWWSLDNFRVLLPYQTPKYIGIVFKLEGDPVRKGVSVVDFEKAWPSLARGVALHGGVVVGGTTAGRAPVDQRKDR